jgi:hypothetical protein
MIAMNQTVYASLAHAELFMVYQNSTITDVNLYNHHKDIAKDIARYVHNELESLSGGGYKWLSWRTSDNFRIEDTSHASTVMRFIVHAHENGYFFNQQDVKSLADTFHFLYINLNEVKSRLDENSEISTEERYLSGLTRMIVLSPYNSSVYLNAQGLIFNGTGTKEGTGSYPVGRSNLELALYLRLSLQFPNDYRELDFLEL